MKGPSFLSACPAVIRLLPLRLLSGDGSVLYALICAPAGGVMAGTRDLTESLTVRAVYAQIVRISCVISDRLAHDFLLDGRLCVHSAQFRPTVGLLCALILPCRSMRGVPVRSVRVRGGWRRSVLCTVCDRAPAQVCACSRGHRGRTCRVVHPFTGAKISNGVRLCAIRAEFRPESGTNCAR